MIRPTIPDDAPAIAAIATAIGFDADELKTLNAMLADSLSNPSDRGPFWVTDEAEDAGPVGVAYCEPERMTDGTWNLLLIAIRPEYQEQGRGTALLHYVERTLNKRGARLLLVETLADFDQARAFYQTRGFEEEARIRDFYAAGADKIVYRKALLPSDRITQVSCHL